MPTAAVKPQVSNWCHWIMTSVISASLQISRSNSAIGGHAHKSESNLLLTTKITASVFFFLEFTLKNGAGMQNKQKETFRKTAIHCKYLQNDFVIFLEVSPMITPTSKLFTCQRLHQLIPTHLFLCLPVSSSLSVCVVLLTHFMQTSEGVLLCSASWEMWQ